MTCILKRCAHQNCRTLGECGASYALERARSECGYQVITRDNPVRSALLKAGLVSESDFDGRTSILRALA